MAKKLSFSIAVNLLTENFKKGTNTVKNSLRSMQMQIITFAAALGAGGLGLSGLITRFKDVARETSRVLTALKNVSGGLTGFADNLRFVNDMARKYGLEVNALTGNFAKFTASATQANMPMDQQKKVFESLSRASTAFGLSAEDTNGVFLALSQMMGKGRISSEELRKQMGERIPVAMQAMAKAAGVSMAGLEKLLKQGKLMSSDVIPKFADAINEMIPNVNTDNLETSLNRLSNTFGKIVNSSGFQKKYKALIDGLTSLLESAGKNIQNIIVGIVAAIGFVVTRGLTKTYQGYADTGKQIVANATITHNKLRAAIAARVEAEKNLESLKLQHAQAVGAKQIALQRQIEKAKQTLSSRTAAVNIAHENAKAAAAQAAAIKSRGAWLTAWAAISGSAKKLMVTLKSMWNSFAPALVVSAIIAILGYFRNISAESKRIKNIFKDYKKDLEATANTAEVTNLQVQLDIMNDKTKSQKEINLAQGILQKQLGKENLSQVEINKLVNERIKLLKEAAMAEAAFATVGDYTEKNAKLAGSVGLSTEQLERFSKLDKLRGKDSSPRNQWYYANTVRAELKKNGNADKGILPSDVAIAAKEYVENAKVIADATNRAAKYQEQITKATDKPDNNPGDKENRTAEKSLEALRKLDEEDRKRQIEKQKFDLDMEQKTIDAMDDSFKKRTKQTELNFEKENLAIEEHQNDLIKRQEEYAKIKFTSQNGTEKGFGDYFNKMKESNFIGDDGKYILPEGLRPGDIEKQVADLLSAAAAAKEKGFNDINSDLSIELREQELLFASDLKKKLAEIDTYYGEKLIKHEGNAEMQKLITENKNRETEAAVLQSINRQLEHEMQYNQQVKELTADRYMFEADRRKEAISQEIADQKEIAKNLSDQLLNDPENDELARQLQNALIALKKLNKEFEKTKIEKLREIASDASEVLSSLRGVLDDFGIKLSDGANKALDGLGQTLDALAEIDITRPVSIITGALKALGGIGKTVFGIVGGADYEGFNELKEKYENISSIWDDLINKKKEYLSESTAAEVGRIEKETIDLIKKQEDAVRRLGEARLAAGSSVGSHSIGYRMWQGSYKFDGMNWKDVSREISSNLGTPFDSIDDMLGMTGEQLLWIKENYSGLWATMDGEFRGMLEQLIEFGDEAIEVGKVVKENLTGLSFDTMKDSFLNLLTDMDSGAKDFADDFQSYLQKAVMKGMLDKAYAKRLEDWYNSFADANRDSMISTQEYEDLQQEWNNIVNDAIKERDSLAGMIGFDATKNESQDSTKGYSVSMDQETGGAILGRITGIHESILEVKSMMSAVNVDTARCLTQSIAIGDELKKHTGIFYEMQQMQVKSYRISESVNEGIASLLDIKDDIAAINKNTKGLAPK